MSTAQIYRSKVRRRVWRRLLGPGSRAWLRLLGPAGWWNRWWSTGPRLGSHDVPGARGS